MLAQTALRARSRMEIASRWPIIGPRSNGREGGRVGILAMAMATDLPDARKRGDGCGGPGSAGHAPADQCGEGSAHVKEIWTARGRVRPRRHRRGRRGAGGERGRAHGLHGERRVGRLHPGNGARGDDRARASLGLTGAFGFGGCGGDFSDVLKKPITGDFNIFRNRGAWRFGVGISFTGMPMPEPYQDEKYWGLQRSYLFATRMLGSEGSTCGPTCSSAAGLARLHPRSELFAFEPPPEEPGDSPTHPANGFSVGPPARPGDPPQQVTRPRPLRPLRLLQRLRIRPESGRTSARQLRHDLRGTRLGCGGTPPTTGRGPPGRGARSTATPGESRRATAGRRRKPSPSTGWPRGRTSTPATRTSPRSAPGAGGTTSKRASPSTTTSSRRTSTSIPGTAPRTTTPGRANGIGYWGSALYALGGAFFWECCGETHPMSYNDLISTGIGGIAVGEQMYRLSSQLLDNQDTGKSRIFREIGGFVIDPVRGFNRAVSGRFTAVQANPEEPLDWRPPHARFFVFAGARIIGEGESISENTNTYGFIGVNHTFGSVYDNSRRKPFDSIAADYQFSFGDKERRTLLRIRGDLYLEGPRGHRRRRRSTPLPSSSTSTTTTTRPTSSASRLSAPASLRGTGSPTRSAWACGGTAWCPSWPRSTPTTPSWPTWRTRSASASTTTGRASAPASRSRSNRGRNRLVGLSYRLQWINVTQRLHLQQGRRVRRERERGIRREPLPAGPGGPPLHSGLQAARGGRRRPGRAAQELLQRGLPRGQGSAQPGGARLPGLRPRPLGQGELDAEAR